MGTLRSLSRSPTGYWHNGVLLGEPSLIKDDEGGLIAYEWNHSVFPNAKCHVESDVLIVLEE